MERFGVGRKIIEKDSIIRFGILMGLNV